MGDQIQFCRIASGKVASVFPVPDQSIDHALFTADSQRLVANSFSEKSHSAQIIRVGSEQAEAVLPLGIFDSAWISFSRPLSFVLRPMQRPWPLSVPNLEFTLTRRDSN